MASFFEKVMWTECTAEMDPKCTKAANREHLPAYKTKCTECGSKAREVVKLDPIKAGIAAVLGLALLGGGGWYLRAKMLDGVRDAITGGGGGSTQPAPASTAISWGIETDRGGTAARLSSSKDFDANGNSFKFRNALTQGDRMRLEVSYKSDRLYAFHRNGSEVSRLPADSGGRASLPPNNDWFQLDANTGTEEFILVAANGAMPELDQMSGNFDPVSLEREIRKLESGGKTPVVRIQIPHR